MQLRRGNLIVYVKRETQTRALVLHPHFLDIAEDMRALGGIDVPDPARTYVNSNLRAFPVYFADHRKSAGRHGFAVGVAATSSPLSSVCSARLQRSQRPRAWCASSRPRTIH